MPAEPPRRAHDDVEPRRQRRLLGALVAAAGAAADPRPAAGEEPGELALTCMASSRVGVMTIACGPAAQGIRPPAPISRRASISPKATVLPEPVPADTRTSRSSSSMRSTARCTGVSRRKPRAARVRANALGRRPLQVIIHSFPGISTPAPGTTGATAGNLPAPELASIARGKFTNR